MGCQSFSAHHFLGGGGGISPPMQKNRHQKSKAVPTSFINAGLVPGSWPHSSNERPATGSLGEALNWHSILPCPLLDRMRILRPLIWCPRSRFA